MNNKTNYLMVTSGIRKSDKFDKSTSSINFFDGTPHSSRVPMGHEHLVQIHNSLHKSM